MSQPLLLASTSRYRAELLARLRLPFEAVAPAVDEARRAGESGPALCQRLAREKAAAVATRFPQAVVIGSDQCAVRGDQVLGKPMDADDACRQLLAASAQNVDFHTAVCVMAPDGTAQTFSDLTRVRFRALDADAVRRYVAIEQPLDCAGSFRVEGLGISLFEAVETRDPTALIGLPLIALSACLRRLGFALP